MILDGHVHMMGGSDDRIEFRRKLGATGIAGGIVMSLPPASFSFLSPPAPARVRLARVLDWCSGADNLFPFFWINPLEPDALRQVSDALRQGIQGFKVITDEFDPGHPKAMRVYKAIAAAGRPILFHSGILWDGKPSSMHTRPVGFEPLMETPGLRFALAHIGWPWCEESVALYGKLLHARRLRKQCTAEMFVDLTPGTPEFRREYALSLLFKILDASANIFFGSDCIAGNYNIAATRKWIHLDKRIFRKLGVSARTIRAIYADNLLRFIRGNV